MELPHSHIRTEPLKNWCQPPGVSVDVLRLDELHPVVSGNKWFKLHYWLERARTEHRKGLITFGGAWSNHLLATAEAARLSGLEAVGLIRGERPAQLSATLQDAEARGMRLHFLSRSDYRTGRLPGELAPAYPPEHFLLIPEGGSGAEGCAGASLIAQTTHWEAYTHIVVAVGTGTTLAGLAAMAGPGQQCIGISVLKNNHSLDGAVAALLTPEQQARYTVLHGFDEGGYARHNTALLTFMNEWYTATGIPSDFVYTGKAFRAADRLLQVGYFASGSRVLLVHSGGLQGNRSLPEGTLMF
ncbi:1-aminocyclopropane-1-carboxylate deaminase/D-cysteine desulfhydrase [Flaviaesturariibacter aridisoli]|uniref:Pyridoxal-phosphate dependent enzyme n=1 Tax=Flaviaesturariibacter aridisoli TaxID=2545761 RepID=A0A4R4E492_9BACT|nr:pyridoxal-phosphate dependent enzyme [Flaviaesturariibacter aridisoli]TCZ74386.1 pyridoxal-phosphate dependent enzyme [Flaviaesturariibacter aridisoli]